MFENQLCFGNVSIIVFFNTLNINKNKTRLKFNLKSLREYNTKHEVFFRQPPWDFLAASVGLLSSLRRTSCRPTCNLRCRAWHSWSKCQSRCWTWRVSCRGRGRRTCSSCWQCLAGSSSSAPGRGRCYRRPRRAWPWSWWQRRRREGRDWPLTKRGAKSDVEFDMKKLVSSWSTKL